MIQSPSIEDVFVYLALFAPVSLAEEWDNVGLQVGTLKEKVKGILVSLDVTGEVLEEASQSGANLLITHHPLFFREVKRLDDSTVAMRLTRLAVERKINILSFHTNLDSTEEGLNDFFAKKIGLKNLRPLISSRDSKRPKAGLGRVGTVQKTTLREYVKTVGRLLRLKNFRYVGDPKQRIQKVAVMTGSGAGFFMEAKAAGADCLVTGDLKYHSALDALAEEMAILDVGHFASEIGMVGLVAAKLRKWSRRKKLSLKVFESQVQNDPFRFWS